MDQAAAVNVRSLQRKCSARVAFGMPHFFFFRQNASRGAPVWANDDTQNLLERWSNGPGSTASSIFNVLVHVTMLN
jgi:hypothetical protein